MKEKDPKDERILVYIDGGNLYRKIKEKASGIEKGQKFCHSSLVHHLARGRELVTKRYYVGIVRDVDNTEKSKTLVQSQQKFLSALEQEGFEIKRGRIVYDNTIREKGIDVKMAIDLVTDAIEDKYDTAIVVSSDTDLVPALQYVRNKGKKVEYVGFSYSFSWGMMKHSDTRVLLLPDDLQTMIRK